MIVRLIFLMQIYRMDFSKSFDLKKEKSFISFFYKFCLFFNVILSGKSLYLKIK